VPAKKRKRKKRLGAAGKAATKSNVGAGVSSEKTHQEEKTGE